MDGMSSLDENTLQQFSDIFKHFQTGKPDEDDEVSSFSNNSPFLVVFIYSYFFFFF